jgi:hypothetical protein
MVEVKSFAKDTAKMLWRQKIVDFIRKHYTPNEIRNFDVLCLPGKEMLEVKQVYDVLGVKRRKIIGLEEIKSEFDLLEEKNNSLEDRIKTKNQTALSFFSATPGLGVQNPKDVISLDFCGYLDQEKDDIMAQIALCGWLKPNAVLITNFLMGRESERAKVAYARQEFIRQNKINIADPKQVISVLRKNDFLTNPEGITPPISFDLADSRDEGAQSLPLAHLFFGTGYWNTDIFNKFVESDTDKQNVNLIKESIDLMNRNRDPFMRAFYLNKMHERISNDVTGIVRYLMLRQIKKLFFLQDHESYKYISDSGRPMISDFFYFQQANFTNPTMNKCLKTIGYHVEDGTLVINSRKRKNLDKVLGFVADAIDGINIQADRNFVKKRVFLTTDVPKLEAKVEEEDRQAVTKDYIYNAIKGGMVDEEIMGEYGLTKMELAGYKATLSRRNGNCGKKETSFSEEDLAIVDQFIAEKYKSTEIAQLFDGKYAWQQIAARKVTMNGNGNGNSTKKRVLERDNFTCQYPGCNKTMNENIETSGHGLHVHHIDYDHDNMDERDQISLCTSCHAKTNTIQHGPEMRQKLEEKILSIYSSSA